MILEPVDGLCDFNPVFQDRSEEVSRRGQAACCRLCTCPRPTTAGLTDIPKLADDGSRRSGRLTYELLRAVH
jgi:hypothetical protein